VATGRDYRDAAPITGISYGTLTEDLSVAVSVEQQQPDQATGDEIPASNGQGQSQSQSQGAGLPQQQGMSQQQGPAKSQQHGMQQQQLRS
jgi:hypothetical protein